MEELWQYTQQVAAEELQDVSRANIQTLDPEKVKQTIDQIDAALKDKPVNKKVKQKLNYAKRNWPDSLRKYEQQEQILQQRNSYSKTDPDATFMRMKEDHMLNGQLKPAYNAQISTHQQIIVNYSIHQNPTDTKTLKPHLESFKQDFGSLPEAIIADAGYGSEENYEYLDNNDIDAYVKDQNFDRDQKRSLTPKRMFHPDNLYYNKNLDCYYCPMGQQMNYIGNSKEKTDAGYIRTLSRYQAQNCQGCPIRGVCHKARENRIIEVSHRLTELKKKARERLKSEEGLVYRRVRPVEAEAVFGMIKHNRGFRRFLLRGIDKVSIEFGLLAMAHNLKKLALHGFFSPIFYSLMKMIKEDFALFQKYYLKENKFSIMLIN